MALTWHEELKLAFEMKYGEGAGVYFDKIDLDDYRHLSAKRAMVRIVRDVKREYPELA
jgi:hypothetical protein